MYVWLCFISFPPFYCALKFKVIQKLPTGHEVRIQDNTYIDFAHPQEHMAQLRMLADLTLHNNLTVQTTVDYYESWASLHLTLINSAS